MSFRERMLKQGDRERATERRERAKANRTRSADIGEFFENEIWTLLDMMGFEELNPRAFRVDATPEGYGSQTKQIDILAQWGKEVLVIECKSSENEKVGLDRKDLSDLYEKRPRLLRSLHAEYGDCQVSFVFWLKNISPIDRDLDDADRFEIAFLDYDDFKEYARTAKLIKAGSKFQLLADLYGPRGKGIRWSRRTPAITGQIAGRTFYYFMADPQKLLPVANVPRRRPHGQKNLEDTERVRVLYQRMLIPKKLKEIQRYIGEANGFFPNNIVVSFARRPKFKPVKDFKPMNLKLGLLSVPEEYGSITIIDGQHRLFGYANFPDQTHLVPVLAFQKLDPNDQGDLFVTINSKQKKVDSNILWDLHEYFGGSLKAAISRVVKELNRRGNSPLSGKIVVPSETRKIGVPLKMTALCTALESARILVTLNDGHEDFDNERTSDIVDTLIWYLDSVRNYNEFTRADWDANRSGYLCTNNGLSTLLFLADAVLRNVSSRFAIETGSGSLAGASANRVKQEIKSLTEPALAFVSTLSEDERASLRRSSSKGQQVMFAAELEAKIKEVHPDFQIVHLKAETGLPVTRFEGLLQKLILYVLQDELGDRWYKEGIHKDYRDKIDATIRKRGYNPDEIDPEERLRYCDLGPLGQIILSRYSGFQSILRVNPSVFEAQLAWMNAYRSGHAAVHTGDTQKYVSLMGRGAMGHYSKVVARYLETRVSSASTQHAGGLGLNA